MKVFTGYNDQVNKASGKDWINFLKPLVNQKGLGESELVRLYGDYYQAIELVDDVHEADFCVLPYSWNYFYKNNRLKEAKELVQRCKGAGKEVVTVTTGDFGVPPLDKDVIVLRQSGYYSKRLKKQFGMPAFITDPIEVFYEGQFETREKGEKPVVGFCGQAVSSKLGYLSMFLTSLQRNAKHYMGLRYFEPQVLYPSTLRRNKVLNHLSNSSMVQSDFIIRDKYRAGAQSEKDRRVSTLEFFNNLRNTDYTICIRGGGNFSVRIYETLAVGRIPLFINTDCVLPLDMMVDWKQHVVWVEEADISRIDEILSDFHTSIHPDDFVQMQLNNRKLWEDRLSFKGFHGCIEDIVDFVSDKTPVVI